MKLLSAVAALLLSLGVRAADAPLPNLNLVYAVQYAGFNAGEADITLKSSPLNPRLVLERVVRTVCGPGSSDTRSRIADCLTFRSGPSARTVSARTSLSKARADARSMTAPLASPTQRLARNGARFKQNRTIKFAP